MVLSEGVRKARKNHMCNFCGGIISCGDSYNYQNNVVDGQVYVWKSHTTCQEIADSFYKYSDDCLTEEDFIENVNLILREYLLEVHLFKMSFIERVELIYTILKMENIKI